MKEGDQLAELGQLGIAVWQAPQISRPPAAFAGLVSSERLYNGYGGYGSYGGCTHGKWF